MHFSAATWVLSLAMLHIAMSYHLFLIHLKKSDAAKKATKRKSVTFKTCPSCAEKVQRKAIICRYCQTDISV